MFILQPKSNYVLIKLQHKNNIYIHIYSFKIILNSFEITSTIVLFSIKGKVLKILYVTCKSLPFKNIMPTEDLQ